MFFLILGEVFLISLALSADSFSVALTDGLTYQDINKRKSFFIAFVFGFMQALMPLIGYWVVELFEILLGEFAGATAGGIAADVIVYVAFGLLLIIGGKMLIESIIEVRKPIEEKKMRKFSVKEVLFYGFATSIDALATGVALHAGLSDNITIWIHISMILVVCFAISLVGCLLGKQINKLLKGKNDIAGIIGGCILILLAIWILVSHLIGL